MEQKVRIIKISDLTLWTENPRDPIDINATDEDIILRAISDEDNKWDLNKLRQDIGSTYHFSDLPTVVEENGKNIVYDGNRRIALIKCLQNPELHAKAGLGLGVDIVSNIDDLQEIPCYVCDKETALDNVERIHSNNGSWTPLQRDNFNNIHRGKAKTSFSIIEDQTGIISSNKKMQQRFVKDEVLNNKNLNTFGFDIKDGKFLSNYSNEEAKKILDAVVKSVNDGNINTNDAVRGQTLNAILKTAPELKDLIKPFDSNDKINIVNIDHKGEVSENESKENEKKSSGSGRTRIKPFIGRKQYPQKLKTIIEECFCKLKDAPNSRMAMTRVVLECVLKYVVENTKYDGIHLIKDSNYFASKNIFPGSKNKYTNFTELKKEFANLIIIKEMSAKTSMNSFDLDRIQQTIHNYKVSISVNCAQVECTNLLHVIEFLMQDEQDLLNKIDITKL